MKLVIISDTHSLHEEMKYDIPDGDVLIHCGDTCNRGTTQEFLEFLEWFGSFPHPDKIFIAGNHDFALQNKSVDVRHALANLDLSGTGIHYLEDSGVTIQDGNNPPVNFWGSPWTPEFYNWAFMKKPGKDLEEVWAKVPDSTHVLITHGPPMTDSFIDRTQYGGQQVGCADLSRRLHDLPQLKLNCFGHIHEGYGDFVHPSGVELINASTCTLRYAPINKPVVYDINGKDLNNK